MRGRCRQAGAGAARHGQPAAGAGKQRKTGIKGPAGKGSSQGSQGSDCKPAQRTSDDLGGVRRLVNQRHLAPAVGGAGGGMGGGGCAGQGRRWAIIEAGAGWRSKRAHLHLGGPSNDVEVRHYVPCIVPDEPAALACRSSEEGRDQGESKCKEGRSRSDSVPRGGGGGGGGKNQQQRHLVVSS